VTVYVVRTIFVDPDPNGHEEFPVFSFRFTQRKLFSKVDRLLCGSVYFWQGRFNTKTAAGAIADRNLQCEFCSREFFVTLGINGFEGLGAFSR
jgi:hypothetical protein